jgi:protein O-mannosyl-transferase
MDRSGRSFPFPKREVLLALGLVALTLGVYGQVYRFEFLNCDDAIYVNRNPNVFGGLSVDSVRWAFRVVHDANWIPLTWLSLMLDATCYGSWPGGYHITNALLHLANVLLVFAIFARATGNPQSSALVAALFAVHPLHAESVAWIAERKDVLSMFFGLLSLFAYVRYAQLDRTAPRRALVALALALVFFVCSLMSKQTFVTLPFLFLLLDYWPLRRFDWGRLAVGTAQAASDGGRGLVSRANGQFRQVGSLLLEKLPFFAASAVFCLVAFWAQDRGGMVRSLSRFSLETRCLNAVLAYALYVGKAVVPIHLAVFYPHPGAQISLAQVGLAALFLVAVTLFAITQARHRPFLLFGWLWFLGTLVPMIGLVQVGEQQLADRYAYLPSIGLYVAVVGLVGSLMPASPLGNRARAIVATGAIAVYASLGFVQVSHWHDGVQLFRHALVAADDNRCARQNLAYALFQRGEFPEALVHAQRSIELEPRDPLSYYITVVILQTQGRWDEANTQFRRAIAVDDHYEDHRAVLSSNSTSWVRSL